MSGDLIVNRRFVSLEWNVWEWLLEVNVGGKGILVWFFMLCVLIGGCWFFSWLFVNFGLVFFNVGMSCKLYISLVFY